MGTGRAKSGAVGAMVSARGKLMVLGEELDLRGQGGTLRKRRHCLEAEEKDLTFLTFLTSDLFFFSKNLQAV